jgi:hypothetical protein
MELINNYINLNNQLKKKLAEGNKARLQMINCDRRTNAYYFKEFEKGTNAYYPFSLREPAVKAFYFHKIYYDTLYECKNIKSDLLKLEEEIKTYMKINNKKTIQFDGGSISKNKDSLVIETTTVDIEHPIIEENNCWYYHDWLYSLEPTEENNLILLNKIKIAKDELTKLTENTNITFKKGIIYVNTIPALKYSEHCELVEVYEKLFPLWKYKYSKSN